MLGAKAGRQRYEQIMSAANRVKDDPHVHSAAATVAETAKEQAPVAAQKVAAAAGGLDRGVGGGRPLAVRHLARGRAQGALNPDSTARQDNPYPQGDLP